MRPRAKVACSLGGRSAKHAGPDRVAVLQHSRVKLARSLSNSGRPSGPRGLRPIPSCLALFQPTLNATLGAGGQLISIGRACDSHYLARAGLVHAPFSFTSREGVRGEITALRTEAWNRIRYHWFAVRRAAPCAAHGLGRVDRESRLEE